MERLWRELLATLGFGVGLHRARARHSLHAFVVPALPTNARAGHPPFLSEKETKSQRPGHPSNFARSTYSYLLLSGSIDQCESHFATSSVVAYSEVVNYTLLRRARLGVGLLCN